MTILDELTKKEVWNSFRTYKEEHHQLGRWEVKELDAFIAEERYPRKIEEIAFCLPEKKLLPKMGTQAKRVVYLYNQDETWILKLLTWLLYRYDDCMEDNCYSFRKGKTAKSVFDEIRKIPDVNTCYVLKADVHNYFNSIDVPLLLEELKEIMTDDAPLFALIKDLLEQDACIFEGEVLSEKRGAMAGMPLSGFFANVYLRKLDRLFREKGIPYFRYSDDILIFAENEEKCSDSFNMLKKVLAERKLELNPKKVSRSAPGEAWEFLGFCYEKGTIDLSKGTIVKMTGRIQRKARKLYRKRKREGLAFEKAAGIMIRSFDRRLYDLSGRNAFTWTRFYFPVITKTEGLHQIDACMVKYLRYLKTGRHNKENYRVLYEDLLKLGYTPLVREYYNWVQERILLEEKAKGS